MTNFFLIGQVKLAVGLPYLRDGTSAVVSGEGGRWKDSVSIVYGEYVHPYCKQGTLVLVYKQIADAGTHPDEVPLGL
jgi:hypothetical protein